MILTGKCNCFQSRSANTHGGRELVNANWGPGPVNTNWVPGQVKTIGDQDRGPGPEPRAGK